MRPPPVLEDGAPQESQEHPPRSKPAEPQGLRLRELGFGWGLGSRLKPLSPCCDASSAKAAAFL